MASTSSRCSTTTNKDFCRQEKSAARKLRFFLLFCLRVYLFWSQVLETISTFETANVLSPWSIFMPELLPVLELPLLELPLAELPLADLSDDGRLPVEVVLPVLLAPAAVVSAVGVVPDALPPAVV